MSKSPIFEHCLLEPPELCPHNKYVQTIGLKYRVEIPVRLTKITHLRKLGGQCKCCRPTSKCEWPSSKNIKHHSRVTGGGEEVHRNDSIFSCRISNAEPSTSSIGRKEKLKNLGKSNSQGSSILNKICRGCKRSKNYLANHGCFANKKESIWIMKPTKLLRHTSSDHLDLNGRFENPIDIPSNNSSDQEVVSQTENDASEFPYLKKLVRSSRYLHSKLKLNTKSAHVSSPRTSTDRCYEEDVKYLKSRKLLKQRQKKAMEAFKKDNKVVMEYFNEEQNLEDIQYKRSKMESSMAPQMSDLSKTKLEMKSRNFKENEDNVFLIPSDLDFLDDINDCSFHDKMTKDLFNSNRRMSMEIRENDESSISTETSENSGVPNIGAIEQFLPTGPKKKLHQKRFNKQTNGSKRKHKRYEFKADQKIIKKSQNSLKENQTNMLEYIEENFEAEKKLQSGGTEKGPKNRQVNKTLTTTPTEELEASYSLHHIKSKVSKPKTNTVEPTKHNSTFPAPMSERFKQKPKNPWNLYQLSWSNPRKFVKMQKPHELVAKSFTSPAKKLNIFNDLQIKNENYHVKPNKTIPKSEFKNFKGDLFLKKPDSVPIYCHSPIRKYELMPSNRGRIVKTTCTLSANEKILFEKNHF